MAVPFVPDDPAFLADPYPTFATLRARAPVHPHPLLGMPVAVSHAACSEILRGGGGRGSIAGSASDRGADSGREPTIPRGGGGRGSIAGSASDRGADSGREPTIPRGGGGSGTGREPPARPARDLGRIWVDAQPSADFAAFNLLHRNSLLEREGQAHARLRGLVAGAFGRGHTARLAPAVAATARALVDDLARRIAADGRADLVAGLAAPLPIDVIARLLDVPEPARSSLRGWSTAIVAMYEPDPGPARRVAAERAAGEFVEALRELAALRTRRPGADLVSDLVAAGLGTDELVGTAALLLMAGHEATVNVVGNGVLALLRDPPQWARLVDGAPLDTAVEELIRYDPPLQLFERTAVRDTTVAGLAVPAGTKVAALLGAAARDPAVFGRPDELDLSRRPNPHLGFGAGVHYCLGAPLARVEVAAALAALRARLPGLRLDGEPVRRPDLVMRGLRELWVTG